MLLKFLKAAWSWALGDPQKWEFQIVLPVGADDVDVWVIERPPSRFCSQEMDDRLLSSMVVILGPLLEYYHKPDGNPGDSVFFEAGEGEGEFEPHCLIAVLAEPLLTRADYDNVGEEVKRAIMAWWPLSSEAPKIVVEANGKLTFDTV